MTDDTTPTLAGVHHFKVPVTDLDRSRQWWTETMAARHLTELDHRGRDGELFAVELALPGVDPLLELRLDPSSARRIAGFDPLTFAVNTQTDLQQWAEHFDEAGTEHSPPLRGLVGWILVIRTPDGLPVRLHTKESHPWDPEGADFDSQWLN